jgi:hypothetical protein
MKIIAAIESPEVACGFSMVSESCGRRIPQAPRILMLLEFDSIRCMRDILTLFLHSIVTIIGLLNRVASAMKP